MKKFLVFALIAAMLLGTLVGCGRKTESSKDEILIGCATSLTGEKALTGEYMKNALELAVENLNANGGLLGKQVKIIYEDDQGTDSGAVNAYNKLSTSGAVAVIGNLYSTLNLAISSEVEKAKIPTIVTGSSVAIGKLGNPYMFQARASDAVAVEAIVNYAVEELGFTKIAIIHDSDSYGQGAREAALATLEKLNIEPVVITTYNTGDKDFTAHIAKIQESDAEVILGFSLQTEAGLIMKQLDVVGNTLPVIGSTSYASAIAIDLAGEAANGVFSVVDYVPTTPLEVGQEFAAAYKEKYDLESDWSGASAYDSFRLFVEAIQNAGTTDSDAICKALEELQDFEGASNVFTFDENHVGGTMVVLVQIEDMIPEVIGTASAK